MADRGRAARSGGANSSARVDGPYRGSSQMTSSGDLDLYPALDAPTKAGGVDVALQYPLNCEEPLFVRSVDSGVGRRGQVPKSEAPMALKLPRWPHRPDTAPSAERAAVYFSVNVSSSAVRLNLPPLDSKPSAVSTIPVRGSTVALTRAPSSLVSR